MKLLPLGIMALGFIFGVFLSSLLSLSFPYLLWFGLLALASFLFWEKYKAKSGAIVWYLSAVFLLGLTIGGWRMESEKIGFENSSLVPAFGTSVLLEGVVTKEPDHRQNSTQLFLETKDGGVLIFTDRNSVIEYGDVLKVEGELSEPETFTTDLGREFDYKNYLRAEGVVAILRYPDIKVIGEGEGNFLLAKLLSGKGVFVDTIKSFLAPPTDGLGLGLLLGVKGALDKETEDTFRESGIIHIVVLSGYNIMLVVAFIMYFLGRLRPRYRLVFGLFGITAFALMVGLSATVLRASVMAAILLLVEYSKRQYDALRALLLAGVVMLFINPYLLLYSIGFQLSFIATWGLIVFSPRLESKLFFVPTWGGVRTLLAVTLATQLAVTPLLLYHIGEVSLVAIVTNLLVLPMVPVAMLATFALGVAGIVYPFLAKLMLPLTYVSLVYIILVAEKLSQVPFATLGVATFSSLWLIPMYGLLIWWWLRRSPHKISPDVTLDGWQVEEELPKQKVTSSEEPATYTPSLFR